MRGYGYTAEPAPALWWRLSAVARPRLPAKRLRGCSSILRVHFLWEEDL